MSIPESKPSDGLLASGDEDARACREISDTHCHEQPRNFALTLAALAATKTGDEIASARLVLAWLLTAVGAPGFMLALLVPIRESGALLPQLVIAALIRRAAVRKWFWAIGSAVQGACLFGMAAVAVSVTGATAGWLILALLVCFALARGVCSVAIKDVMGKTIDRGRRGSLSGWATSAAGFATLGAGLFVQMFVDAGAGALAWLLMAAGLLWLVAAAVYALVVEQPGATGGGANALAEALRSVRLLIDDLHFRRFCITRALLLSTALAFPFYAALASQHSVGLLGLMVGAGGLAGLLAAPIWGRWSDRSSRLVMVAAAVLAGVLGIATLLLDQMGWLNQGGGWLFGVIYFVIATSHHGVRIARATYLIDLGDSDNRAAYTAVSNTLIGILLMAGSAVGLLAESLGAAGIIGLMGVVSLIAAGSALRMREA